MSAAILTRTLRRSWSSPLILWACMGSLLALGLWAYSQVNPELFNAMPDAVLALWGIPRGASPSVLAYSVMLGNMGGLAVAGVAIAWGTAAVAGEERDGTIGVTLGAPVSRWAFLAWKCVGLVTLTLVAVGLLWAAGAALPTMLGIELGESHLGALLTHLLANTLFYGFMALAIGAATGRAPLASGISAGVMATSFLLASLLKLHPDTKDWAKAIPWHWFAGSTPFVNGIDAGHLGLLGGGVALFVVVAFVGFLRRDLKQRGSGASLLDRLRQHPLTARVMELVARGTRASGLVAKLMSQWQVLLGIVVAMMVGMMGLVVGVMYAALRKTITNLSYGLPPEMLAVFGGADMSTPEGFYQTESLGMMSPIAVILVATAVASGAIAGEERRRRMGLLLSTPVPRWRIVGAALVTMVTYVLVVAIATAGGIWLGGVAGGLDIDGRHIVAAGAMLALLGLVFGGLALALSASTGRTSVAVWGTVGVALVMYFLNALMSLNDDTANWAKLSPFHWYGAHQPLLNGIEWGHAGVLAAVAAVLCAAAFPLFARRDLRLG